MKKAKVLIHGTQNSVVTVEHGATDGARFSENVYDENGNVLSLQALIAMAVGAVPPPPDLSTTDWTLVANIPPNVKALEKATGTGFFTVTGDGTGALRTFSGPMSVDITFPDGIDGPPVFALDGDDPAPGLGYSYATHLITGAKGWYLPALFESTGILDGGALSINAGDNTKFDVALAVVGSTSYAASSVSPQRAAAVFGPQLANAVPNLAVIATYVGIQMPAGTLAMQSSPFTAAQTRTIAPLGAVISNGTNLIAVNNLPGVMRAGINQIQDLMAALGPMNLSGNVISPNGANLNINKSAGVIFKQGANFVNDEDNPHGLSLAQLTAANFNYRTSTGTQAATTNAVDVTQYESAPGVLSTVPNNRFTIQRFSVFTSNLLRVQYGQFVYQTMAEAEAALATEAFVTEQNIAENGLLLAFLIVEKSATDLSDPAQAKFIPASKFGGPVGSGGTSITNTDALPEGSVNLYYTNARVLAVADPLGAAANLLTTANTWLLTQTFSLAPIVSAGAVNALFVLDGNAGTARRVVARTGGINRWQWGADGSDNYILASYDDAGTLLGQAYTVDRLTRVVTFNAYLQGRKPWTFVTAATGSNTPNLDNNDATIRTALAGTFTANNPSGTKRNGTPYTFRLRDNGTARAINWGSEYRAMGVALPTTTVANKTLRIMFEANADENTMDLVSVTQQL